MILKPRLQLFSKLIEKIGALSKVGPLHSGHFIVFMLLFLWATSAGAQQTGESNHHTEVYVNFAYAAQLGFGSYDIGGLDVQIYKLPISFTFDLEKYHDWKLILSTPLIYGHYRFREDVLDTDSNQIVRLKADLDTLSFIPGLRLEIPIFDFWTVKPFFDIGLGGELNSDSSPAGLDVSAPLTAIYTVGIKSLLTYDWKKFTFGLGNALIYAGNAELHGKEDQSYTVIETGLSAAYPLGFSIRGYTPDLSLFAIHYRFIPETSFSRFLKNDLNVKNQFEIGTSLGSETPLKLWFIENPRIGVGYRFGDGLTAYTVNFGFPF